MAASLASDKRVPARMLKELSTTSSTSRWLERVAVLRLMKGLAKATTNSISNSSRSDSSRKYLNQARHRIVGRVLLAGESAPGVVVAVAEQHHGADGQVGSLLAQLLEAVADAGRGRVGRQVLEAVDAGRRVVHAVQAGLKGTVEAGQYAVLQRLDGLGLARMPRHLGT
jgi:hypothetical protein